MRLTGKDHDVLQSGLRNLYAHLDLDTFPSVALKLVSSLVPCNLAGYNEVDPIRRRLIVIFDPPDFAQRAMPMIPIWEQFMHQHPVLQHFRDHPNGPPRKITDFLPQKTFEKLELYQDFYRHINAKYQIAIAMPAPQPLTIGIAQNRWDRDFNERDRFLLDTIRPHLRQAYENACVVTDLADKARQLAQAFDRIDRGIIFVDAQCRVKQASAAAIRFAGEYLPNQSLTSTRLPQSLEQWASKQIAALCRREDQASQHPLPLIVEGPHGRLVLRVIADTQPDRFLIVMHNAARLESFQPLRGLDLTDREAEVLYWCIEGKSRSEIGLLLKISERTVQKHLEHIYAKLQVPNRVAAVTKALEWLRL